MEAEEDNPLVLDPLAATLAGPKAMKSSRRRQQPAPKGSGRKIKINLMAIRTKWFDDQLEASLGMPLPTVANPEAEYVASTSSPGNAPRQCVLLGAGMDSRAWRLKLPASLQWYEVDRADVLAAKDVLLTTAGAEFEASTPIGRVESVNTMLEHKIGRIDHHTVAVQYPLRTYSRTTVAADLGDASWIKSLLNAGFDPSKPTVWIAEGLLMYLDADRVPLFLEEVAKLSAVGSALVALSVTEQVIADIKSENGKYSSTLLSEWKFGCPADPREWLQGLGWKAEVVATRASLALALGLKPEICGFDTDPTSPKDGRSLFIAASVLPTAAGAL